MRNKVFRYLKNKYLVTTVVVIVVVIAWMFMRGGGGPKIEFATVTTADVIQKVSVTGKVLPMDKADLAFEKGGIVSKINFKVGDKVNKGDIIATLNSADDYAQLQVAQAQLAELKRGLRPEEYSTDLATLTLASTTLTNSMRDARIALRDSFNKTQTAIFNYADSFFNSAQGSNPIINIPTQTYITQMNINASRLAVTGVLSQWKSDIDQNSATDVVGVLSRSHKYTDTIKKFLDDLSLIVNALNPNNTGLSQTSINSFIATMNSAQSTSVSASNALSSAETSLQSSLSSYSQANNQFNLQKAGASSETISAQQARVDAAYANLSKDNITSPIDGIVTLVSPDIGEYVNAGMTAFAVQSTGSFKIEAHVPEADIAKIAINNTADVTLDAYGSDTIFPASVILIDPAETIIEGVPTYKVTLVFTNNDDRIRSGMTANTDILTHMVSGVLAIPSRAVNDENGVKTVKLLNSDGKTYSIIPVKTGLKGSDGIIEIQSGLSNGDKVVTFVK